VGKVLIRALKTNSGFLEASPIEFGPGLNCIIGARDTCKSTIVETIRFALDNEVERAGIANEGGIIDATLRAGTAACEIETIINGETATLVFEREPGSEPRVYLDGVKQNTTLAASPDAARYSHKPIYSVSQKRKTRNTVSPLWNGPRAHESRSSKRGAKGP
jgi:hypothetical protein